MTTEQLAAIAETRRLFKTGQARALREDAGLSLSEVSEAASVSAAAWWRYENGQRTPRARHALACGRVLTELGDRSQ